MSYSEATQNVTTPSFYSRPRMIKLAKYSSQELTGQEDGFIAYTTLYILMVGTEHYLYIFCFHLNRIDTKQ